MTTEKKENKKAEKKEVLQKKEDFLNWKLLEVQKTVDVSKSGVANYKAFEYSNLIPALLKITNELNILIKPRFKMEFPEGKVALTCVVQIVNLDVVMTRETSEGKQSMYESEMYGDYTVVGDLSRNPKIECGQLYTYAYKNALLKIFNISEGEPAQSDIDSVAINKMKNSGGLNINDNAIPNL